MQVAVIQFPGSNCEYETLRAVESVGLKASIFRWNQSPSELASFRAFVLPGGFSYQDRIRAGTVAAKDSIMAEVARQAEMGRPVLGICNGAQILIESGLVPGLSPGEVEMALATNRMVGRRGFYCAWSYLKVVSRGSDSLWTRKLRRNAVLPAPVAHAEGRFVSAKESVRELLESGRQVVFRYVGPSGEENPGFPYNPNGSVGAVAGLTNPGGNVLAMMPHPERSNWLWQVPPALPGPWGSARRSAVGDYRALEAPGPMRVLFESLRDFLESEA